MPIARRIGRVVRRRVNPIMLRLVGRAGLRSVVDLEHVGRRTGTVRHTPLMAFRSGGTVTVALTYGPEVEWLKNVRAAGRCRMRMGAAILTLGPPRMIDAVHGLSRIAQPQRTLLRWPIRCRDFVELPVVAEARVPGPDAGRPRRTPQEGGGPTVGAG